MVRLIPDDCLFLLRKRFQLLGQQKIKHNESLNLLFVVFVCFIGGKKKREIYVGALYLTSVQRLELKIQKKQCL